MWYLGFRENDQPIRYRIPSPKLPENVEILSSPAIKVSGSSAIQCYAPATGQFLGLVNPATPNAIDRAIEQAGTAQVSWAKTSFRARRQVLRSILQHVLDNQEEICRVACLDSGKTMVDAQLGEILVVCQITVFKHPFWPFFAALDVSGARNYT